MSRLHMPRWTLVQHSKWAAHQDPVFKNVLEPAGLTTHQQLGEVVDAGGALYTDINKAEDAADEASAPSLDRTLYPDQVTDTETPQPLRFHESMTIDGRALYLLPANDAA
ncbi:hypothetical protein ACWEDZ_02770 [Streptomyces sp. NPDC005047]